MKGEIAADLVVAIRFDRRDSLRTAALGLFGHYDADFDWIADAPGQLCAWVVASGSID